eukprot:g11538.t1
MAQRRFLAKKSAGGGKKKSDTPKKGPAAIKARGAAAAAAAGKRGSAGSSSGAAGGGASAKPPPTAAAAVGGAVGGGGGGGGGGGFTKSEMLAARKARKASMNAKSAAATAAAAAAKASERAATATATAAFNKGGAAGGAGARAQGKWGWGAKFLAGTSAGLAVLGIAWQLKPDEVRRLLDDSLVDKFAIWLMGKYALYSSPVKEKLLQDLPVPPGALPPPTLVLDLEGTLLGTIYTRKRGWRVAKRPGLDAFLKEMAQLYEVVVFTDSMGGLADEWITQMDPQGATISQRLYRDGTRYIDGKYVKDLSALNRPLQQTLIIDDNSDCISMQPENAIKVKTFSLEDGSDPTADTVLYDLIPFLRALATQGVADFRDVLRPHVGEDSTAVVADFRSKVNAVRQKEDADRSRGLGGLVRQIAPVVGASRPAAGTGGMLTSKDIVGDAPDTLSPGMAAAAATTKGAPGGGRGGGSQPLPEEKKGGFWSRLKDSAKEREEDFVRKNEVFQRVMEKRMAKEKAKQEAQQKAQQQQ